MNIGYKIKELRLKRSLTQEQLASILMVSTQCISKWENNVTLPDIQMLPQISALFGVSIDELFDLTDDYYLSRLDNMLETRRLIEPEEFCQAEEFLLKKERENADCARYTTMLAYLYNHMAEGYRYLAGEKAKKSIAIEPDKKTTHTVLRMAEQGSQIDWNFENKSKRINYYKKFVKENPSVERGYVCLLDELIVAKRFVEAENVITVMEENIQTLRPAFYKGYLKWVKNERKDAQNVWDEMLSTYSDNWLAYALLGDCMASFCEYDKAIEYYEKSLELQEKPRYTDSQISIAMIYEIIGEKDKAVEAWNKVLDILTKEHNMTEGYYIDEVNEEIVRLQK